MRAAQPLWWREVGHCTDNKSSKFPSTSKYHPIGSQASLRCFTRTSRRTSVQPATFHTGSHLWNQHNLRPTTSVVVLESVFSLPHCCSVLTSVSSSERYLSIYYQKIGPELWQMLKCCAFWLFLLLFSVSKRHQLVAEMSEKLPAHP